VRAATPDGRKGGAADPQGIGDSVEELGISFESELLRVLPEQSAGLLAPCIVNAGHRCALPEIIS